MGLGFTSRTEYSCARTWASSSRNPRPLGREDVKKRTHNYDTTGRIQNESESDEDSEQLIKFLKDNNIKHKNVNSHTLLSAYISYEIINV